MTAVPKPKLTEAEYLALERAAEFKNEFYDGVMSPMQGPGVPGASFVHCRIKENIVGELGGQLKGRPYQTLSSTMRVKVPATGSYTYPDILVECGPPVLEDEHCDTLLNPVAIIEVLAPATEARNRGLRFEHFQKLPSVREYVLVSQSKVRVERFVRQPDETWLLTIFDDLAAELAFATVPARVSLADIYAGVTFPESPLR